MRRAAGLLVGARRGCAAAGTRGFETWRGPVAAAAPSSGEATNLARDQRDGEASPPSPAPPRRAHLDGWVAPAQEKEKRGARLAALRETLRTPVQPAPLPMPPDVVSARTAPAHIQSPPYDVDVASFCLRPEQALHCPGSNAVLYPLPPLRRPVRFSTHRSTSALAPPASSFPM